MFGEDVSEIFASEKVYEKVKEGLKNYMRKKEVEEVINELGLEDAKSHNFITKLGVVLKKHTHSSKIDKILMHVKEKLRELIEVEIKPEELKIGKGDEKDFKVHVGNKTGETMRFEVEVSQKNKKNTNVIEVKKKGYSLSRVKKAFPIKSGKAHVFKFSINPDVFEIKDRYELQKEGSIKIKLDIKVRSSDMDGISYGPEIVEVKIQNKKR